MTNNMPIISLSSQYIFLLLTKMRREGQKRGENDKDEKKRTGSRGG